MYKQELVENTLEDQDQDEGEDKLPTQEEFSLLAEVEDEPASTEPQTAVDSEGWLYDVNTGEVIGRAEIGPDQPFEVHSIDAADWVLQLRSQCEGNIAGIRARLQALTLMLKGLEQDQIRRLSWLDYRLGPSLVKFARSILTGKSKTAKFTWGKVAFRSSAGTNQIIAMDEAVAWMKIYRPDRVKRKVTETVTIKDIIATRQEIAREGGEEPESLGWLKSTGPQESVTITTGIEGVEAQKGLPR